MVKIRTTLSATIATNIGAPEGCVLSPVYFTICANNYKGKEPQTLISKCGDGAGAMMNMSTMQENVSNYAD